MALACFAACAAALWNLTYEAEHRSAVVAAGAIPALVCLLHSTSLEVQQHAAGALGNLSVEPASARAIAEQAGCTLLVTLLGSPSMQVLEFAAGIVHDLASTNVENGKAIAMAGGIPALVNLLSHGQAACDGSWQQAGIRLSAVGALAYLAADAALAKAIADAGGVNALVAIAAGNGSGSTLISTGSTITSATSSSLKEQEYAATALGFMALDPESSKAVHAAGGVVPLLQLLDSSSTAVRVAAAGAISNLAADADHRKAIADAGGVQLLLQLLMQAAGAAADSVFISAQQCQPHNAALVLPALPDTVGSTAGTTSCAATGMTVGHTASAASSLTTEEGRPRLSLTGSVVSMSESLLSQPDSWLCPMSSVAPLVSDASPQAV